MMEKLFYLALLILSLNARSQKQVLFKIKYLPDKTYTGSIKTVMNAHITLSGNDSIILKLQSQGLKQPITFNMGMKMDGSTRTGKLTLNKSFPIKFGYKFDDFTVNVNGKNSPIPQGKLGAGLFLYGHIYANGKMKADSIAGAKVSDTSQQHLAQLISAVQKNIRFPGHPMKIGESFIEDMPISIPLAGYNIAANSKVIYKLVSITTGKANFDIKMNTDMNIPVSGATLHITGTGTGNMVYDISANFGTAYNTISNLKIAGDIKTLHINATAVLNTGYNYTVN